MLLARFENPVWKCLLNRIKGFDLGIKFYYFIVVKLALCNVALILADQVCSGMSGTSATTSRQVSLTLWECQTLKGKCCESTWLLALWECRTALRECSTVRVQNSTERVQARYCESTTRLGVIDWEHCESDVVSSSDHDNWGWSWQEWGKVDPKKEAEEAEKARYEAKRAQMRKAQAEHDEILAKFQKQAHESDLQEQKKQQEQLQKQQHDLRQQLQQQQMQQKQQEQQQLLQQKSQEQLLQQQQQQQLWQQNQAQQQLWQQQQQEQLLLQQQQQERVQQQQLLAYQAQPQMRAEQQQPQQWQQQPQQWHQPEPRQPQEEAEVAKGKGKSKGGMKQNRHDWPAQNARDESRYRKLILLNKETTFCLFWGIFGFTLALWECWSMFWFSHWHCESARFMLALWECRPLFFSCWHCFTGVHQELEEQVERIRKQKDTMEDELTGKVSKLKMQNKELNAELESAKGKRKDRILDQLFWWCSIF